MSKNYKENRLAAFTTTAVHKGWRWPGHSRWSMDTAGNLYRNYQIQDIKEGRMFGPYVDVEGSQVNPAHLRIAISRNLSLNKKQVNAMHVQTPDIKKPTYREQGYCFPNDPCYIIETRGREFKLIPGFTKYAISKDGSILVRETREIIHLKHDQGHIRDHYKAILRGVASMFRRTSLRSDLTGEMVTPDTEYLIARAWAKHNPLEPMDKWEVNARHEWVFVQ